MRRIFPIEHISPSYASPTISNQLPPPILSFGLGGKGTKIRPPLRTLSKCYSESCHYKSYAYVTMINSRDKCNIS